MMKVKCFETDREAVMEAVGSAVYCKVRVCLRSEAPKNVLTDEICKILQGMRDCLIDDIDLLKSGIEFSTGDSVEIKEVR